MFLKKISFFLILLAVSLLVSSLVSSLFGYNIWTNHMIGTHFLFFTLLGCCVYFIFKFSRSFYAYAAGIFLALLFAYQLSKSPYIIIGGFPSLILYALALFLSFTFILRHLWFNRAGHLRNVIFSLAAALSYTLVHVIVHLLLKVPIKGIMLLHNYLYGLLIMITLSTAFTLSELIFIRIDNMFFHQLDSKFDAPDDEED